MTAFIHVGPPKTGSSSIHEFVVENARAFDEAGCLVPAGMEMSNAWMFRHMERASVPVPAWMVGDPVFASMAKDWRVPFEADMAARGRHRDSLLSCELFFACEDPAAMFDALPDPERHAFVFVRDQAEVFDSAVQELVRLPDVPYEERRESVRSSVLDYGAWHDRWTAAGFAYTQLPYGPNAVGQTLDTMGPAYAAVARGADVELFANRTLPAPVVLYLMERKGSFAGDPRWTLVFEAFMRAHPLFARYPRGWCMPEDDLAAVRRNHAPVNREFAARFPHLADRFDRRDNARNAPYDETRLRAACDHVYRHALIDAGLAKR